MITKVAMQSELHNGVETQPKPWPPQAEAMATPNTVTFLGEYEYRPKGNDRLITSPTKGGSVCTRLSTREGPSPVNALPKGK